MGEKWRIDEVGNIQYMNALGDWCTLALPELVKVLNAYDQVDAEYQSIQWNIRRLGLVDDIKAVPDQLFTPLKRRDGGRQE